MNRRTLLQAAAAAGGALALPRSHAEPAPPAAKGPPVWLDLDQKGLDDAYDQSVWATNGKQVLGRYAALSDDVRARLGAPQRFSYGATPIEALDVYRARNNAPIQIFLHSGAWRSGTAKDWAFPADMFVHRGMRLFARLHVMIDAGGGCPRWPSGCEPRSRGPPQRKALRRRSRAHVLSGHSSGISPASPRPAEAPQAPATS
jgi:arylformamidase